ncbi:MAG: DNA polymerase III subunit delta' [Planctomycetota bacterium]
MAAALGDILGQGTAIGQLQAMLASGRLHHGLIFHGPAGVGKFTTAVALARRVLCHQPETTLTGETLACGHCASCKLFRPPPEDEAGDDDANASGVAHPDLHVVTKELSRYSDDANVRARKLTNIPVDVLKEHLIGPAFRSAQLGHGKFFIVDEAELIRGEGQNALLKTLEEPPSGTTIVLVTSSEERLLPTIRSRCQRIAFVPLPPDDVARFIHREAPQLDGNSAAWVARFADGSLGRAALALEHGLTAWADALLPMLQGLSQGRAVPEFGEASADRIEAFAEGWVKANANASKEAANKLAADLLAQLITAEARHVLRQRANDIPASDPISGDNALGPWLSVIDAVSAFRGRLGSNVNLKLACAGLSADLHAAFTQPAGSPA